MRRYHRNLNCSDCSGWIIARLYSGRCLRCHRRWLRAQEVGAIPNPGTAAKIKLMTARAAARLPLFNAGEPEYRPSPPVLPTAHLHRT